MKFNSLDNTNGYSKSQIEPKDIGTKRLKSAYLPRPQPSAIFVGMEVATRPIREVNPNNSCLGNVSVKL